MDRLRLNPSVPRRCNQTFCFRVFHGTLLAVRIQKIKIRPPNPEVIVTGRRLELTPSNQLDVGECQVRLRFGQLRGDPLAHEKELDIGVTSLRGGTLRPSLRDHHLVEKDPVCCPFAAIKKTQS
jgi:hypothetical protein